MRNYSPRELRRVLSRGAFLVIWGGWTLSLALYATAFSSASLWTLLHVGATWIGLGLWEASFRRRYLPPDAHRPWAAWFVLVPITLTALILLYGERIQSITPGSYSNRTFLVYSPKVPEGPRRPPIVLEMHSLKSNWGRGQRSVRFGKSKIYQKGFAESGRAWIIDRHAKAARRVGDPALIEVSAEGLERVLTDLAGNDYTTTQLELVARSLEDYLRHRGPLPPLARHPPWLRRSNLVHTQGGSSGSVRWPWVWIAAGFFSTLMLAVTWFTVRRTMFPPSRRPASPSPQAPPGPTEPHGTSF